MITKQQVLEELERAKRIAEAEGYVVADYQVQCLRTWLGFDDLETQEKSAATRQRAAAAKGSPVRQAAIDFKVRHGSLPTIGRLEKLLSLHEIEAPSRRTMQRILRELRGEEE